MINLFNIGWSAPANVHALTTTRQGGVSEGVYQGLNLANHVEDCDSAVNRNREILNKELNLNRQPKWLNQTHSTNIVIADQISETSIVDADGTFTTNHNCICAVLTADCLPVFITDENGRSVGVFHAGWRGLANGILVNAVNIMKPHSGELIAAIGPAISQSSFEVGNEVRDVFLTGNQKTEECFIPSNNRGHFFADLYGLAKIQLLDMGVKSVWLPESVCTYKDYQHFYSYRRDGQTGRMASLIWISQ